MALVIERVIRVVAVILGRNFTAAGRGVSVCLANVENRRLVETDGTSGVVNRLLAVVEVGLGRGMGGVLDRDSVVFTLLISAVKIGFITLIVLFSRFESAQKLHLRF